TNNGPNPAFTSSPGNTVSLSATVTSTGGTVNNGTVTFFDGGTAITGATNVTVNSSGVASVNISFSTEGVHTLTAQYNGGTGFAQSTVSSSTTETTVNHPTGPISNSDGSIGYCNGPVPLGNGGAGGNPYPSLLILPSNAFSGVIEKLTVSLNGLQTQDPQDLGFGLQSPAGTSVFDFMSFADGSSSTIGSAINLLITDTGASTITGNSSVNCTNGCLPTDNANQYGTILPDTFPSPAPTTINKAAPTGNSTFANQFGGLGGTNVNGTWGLYLDNRGTENPPFGQLATWCLNFTMQANAHPTQTVISASPSPALTTSTVTLTATVTVTDSSGLTVNSGTVTFVDGTTNLGTANVVGGVASTNVTLGERDHQIFANYSGTSTGTIFGISTNHTDLRVDTPTTESGTAPYSYCNTGIINVPGLSADFGAASPYPSNVTVTDLPGTVKALTVTMKGFATNDVNDLASLLVGPGGNNLDFFSFTGASPGADTFGSTSYNLTLDDTAPAGHISGIDPTGGLYQPTSFNSGGNLTAYPACPPTVTDCLSANVGPPLSSDPFTPSNKAFSAGSGIFGDATTAGVFGGGTTSTYNGNGTWSLYLYDAPHGGGRLTTLNGGWCANFTENLPDISLTNTPMTHSPSTFTRGQSASFTITATNLGPGPSGNPTLTITDTLPPGLTYTGFSGTGWNCTVNGPTVTCTNSNPIVANASSAVTINASVGNTAADIVSNSASITAGTGGDNPATTSNDTTSSGSITVAGTILTINKTHTDPFTQNQTGATYSITVKNTGANGSNTGPGVTVGTVTVTDTLPGGLTATGFSGSGWTCQPLPALMCTLNSPLPVGATSNAITLTVNVSNSVLGPITNTANLQATTDQIGSASNNTHDDPTNITQVPTQILTNNGTTPQSAQINTAFANALAVTVEDAGNNPVPNVSVAFTPPGSGASGTFAVINSGNQNCSASLCTVTTNASGVATASTFTANGTAGGYNVQAKNAALTANFSLTNTDTPATVTSVSSTAVNGSYGAGSVIPITVTFSKAVNVTGTPLLALNDGGSASYASGSGGTTLTFSYTVVAGQNVATLDAASTTALTLNGGTIQNLSTVNATLTLPAPGGANSLGSNKSIKIDTTAPTVTSVSSSTANGSYGTSAVVNITVTFSKAVAVTGTPQLALNSGGTANYSSGSGGATLTFAYTVGSGQNASHLDYTSTTALTLNGGTIKDTVTNPNAAVLTLPAPGAANSLSANTNIVIDTTAPTVTSVSSTTANGTYGVAATINVTVTFSESVNVTGTPQIALNSGGTASYASGSGTSALTFTYTVSAGQNSSHLDYTSTGALTLNGGTIKDAATNNATLTLPTPGGAGSLSANSNIVINTTAPTVTSVSSTTANGSYGSGATITVTVNFSAPVIVTGTPQLSLNSGGTASYASGSGTSTLTFSYVVANGQNSSHLDYTSTTALSLNGGTIKDSANNSATLTLPAPGGAGSLAGNKNIIIDTVAPTVTNVSSTTPNGTYGTGAGINVTVTFSEAVNVTGTPQIALNSGGSASYASGSGTSTLTFTYVVASGQSSSHLDYTSTSALILNGGTIKDAAGNNATLTLAAPGTAGSLSANTSIVITTKTTPTVTWTNPSDIVFGSALSGIQLNATASVPGTFIYTPPAGTVLGVGSGQTLSVAFTPTDTTNYNSATGSVLINVLPASGPATLVVTRTLARDANNNDVLVTLTIANTGGTAATGVTLNSAKIGTAVSTTPLPAALTDIPAGGSQSITVRFAAGTVGNTGAAAVLSISGVYNAGAFGGSSRITLP
ncbi:MAG TPA: Ig-like domain repeat protein, partial [Bryobacteraceae bacterium]